MSGTASVPNTFASAVTATGLQLDTNYNTIVAYINDPTNRNNYASDNGNTNTIALSFAPAVVGGYTAGLELTFKAAITNSGAVVLNANSLGNQNFINPDGSALASGQIQAGGIYKAAHNGSAFVFIGGLPAASKAQMQTATAVGSFVSPAQTQNHPGVAKAWAFFSGTATGTISALASYNISQIVKLGTGTYSIAVSTAFSSTAWGPQLTSSQAQILLDAQDTTSCVTHTTDSTGTAANATFVSFAAYGTQ